MDKLKRGGGRKRGTSKDYAKHLGIHYRQLLRLGGEARLREMNPETRSLFISIAKKRSTQKHQTS